MALPVLITALALPSLLSTKQYLESQNYTAFAVIESAAEFVDYFYSVTHLNSAAESVEYSFEMFALNCSLAIFFRAYRFIS